jgi:Phage tail assembly chaperone protein
MTIMTIWENGVVREYTAEEYAQHEKEVLELKKFFILEQRAQRDRFLAATDWTQAADIPQATRDKYVAYRQALRDVPQQPGFPDNIQWPVKPE